MILVDKEISAFLENGQKLDASGQTAIYDGRKDCITNVGYDLTASGFVKDGSLLEEMDLCPGESVFVESIETVLFDTNTCGTVHIKNSRLRMGLSLDAPVYQPGHHTKIFFRLTNLSDNAFHLYKGCQYATLIFEQLSCQPDHPYTGTFQNETQYSGLAEYSSVYDKEIRTFEKKKVDLSQMEKSIYGNIITILSIFIAIFSMVNVNFTMVQNGASLSQFLSFNLSLIGGIGALSALMEEIIHRNNSPRHAFWLIPVICFLTVAVSAFIL